MISDYEFQNKIEFGAEHKYIKTFYMINDNEAYKNFKKYVFVFACVYMSCIMHLLITSIFLFDIDSFLSIIFNPFMGGHQSNLELYLKPFLFLYPLCMMFWNYNNMNMHGEYKLWYIKDEQRNSFINFNPKNIVYNICGKVGEVKYTDISSCHKWKNYIFIECKNSENIIIPCKDKKERNGMLYNIKKKIQEEMKEVYKDNVDEWVNNILVIFGFVKKSKLFLISLWINFVYFYLVGLEYEKYNFIQAFAVRTYSYGNKSICYRVYEILVICVVLTIATRIYKLIKINKAKEECRYAKNNMDSK